MTSGPTIPPVTGVPMTPAPGACGAGPLGPRSLLRVDSGSASHPVGSACVSLFGGIPASRRSLMLAVSAPAVGAIALIRLGFAAIF